MANADPKHPNPDIPAPPAEDMQGAGVGKARRPAEPRPAHGPIGVDAGKAEALGMKAKGVEDRPAEKRPRR